ncbi:MAG: hypothetical protein ISR73_05320 [Gammaproteobacteria bacterium]|nr:hypothetical protein [Gammaproteobacteria bacterium]
MNKLVKFFLLLLFVLTPIVIYLSGWEDIEFYSDDPKIGRKYKFNQSVVFVTGFDEYLGGKFLFKNYPTIIGKKDWWVTGYIYFPLSKINEIPPDMLFEITEVFSSESKGFLAPGIEIKYSVLMDNQNKEYANAKAFLMKTQQLESNKSAHSFTRTAVYEHRLFFSLRVG